MTFRVGAWLMLSAGVLAGQTLSEANLNGKFYFRHLLFTTDNAENITSAAGLSGSITFDGMGNYSFTGQQTSGTTPPAPVSGSGTYTVSAAGNVSLTNPQSPALTIFARYGSARTNEVMLVGSSTDGAANSFDLFVAIEAPAGPASNASLSGTYYVSSLSFPSGAASNVRDALFSMQPDGQGNLGTINISGHAAGLSNGAPVSQVLNGSSYSINADGSGSAVFPLAAGNTSTTQLVSGDETIFVSGGGDVILGGSSDPGVEDFLIGFKSQSGVAWSGFFWNAGLRFESVGEAAAYSGSLYSTGVGTLTFTRRLHQLQPSGGIVYDFTGANPYTLPASGLGTAELTSIALGAAGNAFVGSASDPNDPFGYEVYVGVRMPTLSGPGVFLNPQGVANAASFAPAGNSIAPGEFVSLFGSNLANSTQAALAPYPPSLAGVTVTVNNVAAPLQYVSSGLVHVLVPYATSGLTATIVVNNNGQVSNAVQVPVAPTAPGVFSLSQNGIGEGAILHANYTVVNSASPAKRGETVLVYLTGLGAVNPPVADGAPGGSNPLNRTPVPNVLIGGQSAAVSFAGLAPGFPGLYQLNVTVPQDLLLTTPGTLPLAVQTLASFHDMVDIFVSP